MIFNVNNVIKVMGWISGIYHPKRPGAYQVASLLSSWSISEDGFVVDFDALAMLL
jgi:hypothetical protein